MKEVVRHIRFLSIGYIEEKIWDKTPQNFEKMLKIDFSKNSKKCMLCVHKNCGILFFLHIFGNTPQFWLLYDTPFLCGETRALYFDGYQWTCFWFTIKQKTWICHCIFAAQKLALFVQNYFFLFFGMLI